jgi:hypothetical protein
VAFNHVYATDRGVYILEVWKNGGLNAKKLAKRHRETTERP